MRYLLLLFTSVLVLSCTATTKPAKKEKKIPSTPTLNFKPNILWVVAEDLGPYIPPFGDSTIQTPVLSKLAKEGVRYTHVFSPSGVCAPSRAAIALGMYPMSSGAHNMRTGGNPKYFPKDIIPYEAMPPAEAMMHSEYLRRAGYYCTNNSKEDYQFRKPVTAWDESSRQAHWRNRKPGQPFFAIFNFTITHESQIWARAKDSLWVDENLDVPVPPYLPDNEVGRRDVRQMYSNIKQMDAQVGEIIRQLEEDGLMDSTIIFWYTDHGGPLPRMKRLCYDSGLRLPMIIRFPNKYRAGAIDSQLISFIDFKPTLLSLSGINPPDYIDGRAFLGQYEDPMKRSYIHGGGDRFDAKRDMIRAVRDKRYKYLRNYKPDQPYYLPVAYREQMPVMKELLRMRDAGELDEFQAQWFRETKDEEELFDCEKDPHELHNLAKDPAYANKLAELRVECDRWMKEISDRGVKPEAEYLASIWPDFKQPETAPLQVKKEKGMLSLSCETPGASIGYQIINWRAEPGMNWQIYTTPLKLERGEKLVAVAHRIGYKPSEQIEAR